MLLRLPSSAPLLRPLTSSLSRSITFTKHKLPKQDTELTGKMAEFIVSLFHQPKRSDDVDPRYYEEFFGHKLDPELRLPPPVTTKDHLYNQRFGDYTIPAYKHIFGPPSHMPYQRINHGRLYRYFKDAHTKQKEERLSSDIQDLIAPLNLFDEDLGLLLIGLKQEANQDKLLQAKEKILKCTQLEIGEIALFLAKLGLNEKLLWYALEDKALQELHHLDLKTLCRLEYAHRQLKPKFTGKNLNAALETQIFKLFDGAPKTVERVNLVAKALSMSRKKQNYQKLWEVLRTERKALLDGREKRCESAIDLIYHWFSNKPSTGTYMHRKPYHIQEMMFLLQDYQADLISELESVSDEHLAKLALALYIYRIDGFEIMLKRVEREVVRRKDKLDGIILPQIVRSLNSCNQGVGSGADKSYVQLQSAILNKFGEMGTRDQAHMMYTYANRKQGNPELYTRFDAELQDLITHADPQTTHSLLQYMMIRDKQEYKAHWAAWLEACDKIDIIPLYYYQVYKAGYTYVMHRYPDWDLDNLRSRMYYAEQIFNVTKLEHLFMKHSQYDEMKIFIERDLNLVTVPLMAWENTFLLHYAWPRFKIALNLYLDHQLVDPRAKRIPGKYSIVQKVMRHAGWEVLNTSMEEYRSLDAMARVQHYEARLRGALDRQRELGVLPARPPVYA